MTELDLNGNPNFGDGIEIGDEGFVQLAKELRGNKTLTSLKLGFNNLKEETGKELRQILQYNSSITSIQAYENSLGSEGLRCLCDGLKRNNTLRQLSLQKNKIQSGGAKHIAEALRVNNTLQKLDLRSNLIGGEGAAMLVEAVKLNDRIKEIEIDPLVGLEGLEESFFLELYSLLKENNKNPEEAKMRVVGNYLVLLFKEKKFLSQQEEAKLVRKYDIVDKKKLFSKFTQFGKDMQSEIESTINKIKINSSQLWILVEEEEKLEDIRILLSKGSNCNLKDSKTKKTVLHLACEKKPIRLELVTLLIENGASAFSRDKEKNNFFDYLRKEESLWRGEWKEGLQWKGMGGCVWSWEKGEEVWMYEGELSEGKPLEEHYLLLTSLSSPKSSLKCKFLDGKRIGEAILTERGKEYFVEFDARGFEKIDLRRRTFEGVRLMLIGCKDVGKTTFRRRLLGSQNEQLNKKAFLQVQQTKSEEDMTHGVEIDRLYDSSYSSLFSVWDFAGHEEYHIAHSYFFNSASVYLIFFDCSVDLKDIIHQNKLLYWFHFINTQVGRGTSIILIATKLDLLEKQFEKREKEKKTRERLKRINNILSKLISLNKITLRFHKFREAKETPENLSQQYKQAEKKASEEEEEEEEEYFFFAMKNKELDIFSSGISHIYQLLVKEYDNIEHSVSTTLKHKLVFQMIEKLASVHVNVSNLPLLPSPIHPGAPYPPLTSSFTFSSPPSPNSSPHNSPPLPFSGLTSSLYYSDLINFPLESSSFLNPSSSSSSSSTGRSSFLYSESSPSSSLASSPPFSPPLSSPVLRQYVGEKEKEKESESKKEMTNSNLTTSPTKEREEERQEERRGKSPFLQVSLLREMLREKSEESKRGERQEASREEMKEASVELEKILKDLTKLGLLVYFDHPSLPDILIPDPMWLNNMFKALLDVGRRRVEVMVERIGANLKEMEERGSLKYIRGDKESSSLIVGRLRKRVIGKANWEGSVEEIWKCKQEKMKSRVDKISFFALMEQLEFLTLKLELEKNQEAMKGLLPNPSLTPPHSICQEVHVVGEEMLEFVVNQILGPVFLLDKQMREFVVHLLFQLDMLLPRRRLSHSPLLREGVREGVGEEERLVGVEEKREREFLVPLLFPSLPPPSLSLSSLPLKLVKRKYEWKVEYLLPFHPSSLWKMLSLKLRNASLSSPLFTSLPSPPKPTSRLGGEGREEEGVSQVVEEVYWRDGFLLHFRSLLFSNQLSFFFSVSLPFSLPIEGKFGRLKDVGEAFSSPLLI